MKKYVQILLRLCIFVFSLFLLTSCFKKELKESVELSSSETSSNVEQEKEEYELLFFAENGNIISGRWQIVKEGENSEKIVIEAKEGYYFSYWSDEYYETDKKNEDESITRVERIIENVQENLSYFATFEKKTYTIEYQVEGYGKIEGEQHQKVKYEEDGTSVTAVADIGYRFVGWSDGVDTSTRQEIELKEDIEVIAYFEIITNEYTYNYKYATDNCDIKAKELTYGQLKNETLVVPIREHCTFMGWYDDKDFKMPVSDEQGNLLIDDSFFYSECKEFYAKWKSHNENTYKLLIIYVTELNGYFWSHDNKYQKRVDYKMNETEREICHMVTNKMRYFLNDLSVGYFQVDEYFTTIPLTEKNTYLDGHIHIGIKAYEIPEVKDMLNNYSSILVSFSANDYNHELHRYTGSAIPKYGSIHFDSLLNNLIINDEPIEYLLDENFWRWDITLEAYIHEFIHTIEMRINTFEFHDTLDLKKYDYRDVNGLNRLYLLNQATKKGQDENDNERVGIPYEFWEGKVAKIYYEAEEGGGVDSTFNIVIEDLKKIGDCVQYVIHGYDALSVKAIAIPGYEFIRWSDGVMEAERKDLNVTEDKYVIAMFRKIEE